MRTILLLSLLLGAGAVQAAPALPTHDGQLAFEAQWPLRFSAQAAFGKGTFLPRAKVEAGLLQKTLRTEIGASLALFRNDWLLWTVGADLGTIGLVDVRAFPGLSSQADTTVLLHAGPVEGFLRPYAGVDVRALPQQGLLRAALQVGAGVRWHGFGAYLTAEGGGSWFSHSSVRPQAAVGAALVLPLFLL